MWTRNEAKLSPQREEKASQYVVVLQMNVLDFLFIFPSGQFESTRVVVK